MVHSRWLYLNKINIRSSEIKSRNKDKEDGWLITNSSAFTVYLHIGMILCEIVAVLFNVQNFKDEWKDNTFHKQPKMIVKNGKRRFHHCRILLQFGEIYSSEVDGKNQWIPTMKDNFIIHNSYKRWHLFIGIDSAGQSNSCLTILYGKSKTYGKKKIHQTITDSWCSATDNLYN